MQQTHASVQMPLRLVQMERESGHPWSILFSREEGSQREGCIDPDAGISPCANIMEKHAFKAHFDGKIYQ